MSNESVTGAKFWNTTALEDLSDGQWEALCDGCGKCCLHKLEDEDTGDIAYTRVACQLLDLETVRCGDYANRLRRIPGCVNVRTLETDSYHWLPSTCAYRLRQAGQPLPDWHPLIAGSPAGLLAEGHSVRDFAISESGVDASDLEPHIIDWVEV